MAKIAFPRTMRNLDPGKLSSALAENMRYLENILNQTFNFDHAVLSNIGIDDHHVKYTDAEVDTIVATHTAISGAHHVKYTDAEVDAIVATHAAIAAAHHAKYTDAEAVTAMGVKADSNPLNHDQAGAALTTKGDVHTYDTDDVRLPVGTDGDVLISDSGETTGLRWSFPIRARGQSLANKGTFVAVSTWEDWGVSLNMGTPGENVFVTGHVTGSILGGAGINRAGQVRVGISFDTGSTWTYGPHTWFQVDDNTATIRRSFCGASHQRSGVPSSEVRVKVQALISGGLVTDLDFVTGQLSAQWSIA